jgi:hypothetical protein
MAAVCYHLKRLLKWMGEKEFKGGKKTLLHFILLWRLLVQESRKSRFSWAIGR